jgi:hypothetical protein
MMVGFRQRGGKDSLLPWVTLGPSPKAIVAQSLAIKANYFVPRGLQTPGWCQTVGRFKSLILKWCKSGAGGSCL